MASPDFANGAVTGAFAYVATNMTEGASQRALRSGFNNAARDPDCVDCTRVSGPGVNPDDASFDALLRAAEAAYAEYPRTIATSLPPFSWLRGIQIHSFFAAEVGRLGPMYAAEVSYKNGVLVPYGTKGSIRADAIYGPLAKPNYAVELKSGLAVPTPAEMRAYDANLPPGTPVHSIVEEPGP